MNTVSKKTAIGVAMAAITAFAVYTVCFMAILIINEPFVWSGVEAYVAYEAENSVVFKYIGMACVIVYACAFPVMVLFFRETVPKEKRVYANAAVVFSALFCVCVSINYFVQITATRLQLREGMTDGLLQITQAYSISALNAINMLGWTLFYALASLGVLIAAQHTKTCRALRVFCALNAVAMAMGLVGYIGDLFLVLLISMNLMLGVAGIGMTAGFLSCFRKTL